MLFGCSLLPCEANPRMMGANFQDSPMARVVSKPKSKQQSAGVSKRSVGRPVGSKNKAKAKPVVKAATKKVASPVAKFSKAELEAQVVKLERSLARSRKQVAELKLLASGSPARGEQAADTSEASPPVAKKTPRSAGKAPKQKAVASRGRRKKSDDVVLVLGEVTGEAETEAHAS